MASVAETIAASADPIFPLAGFFPGLTVREHVAIELMKAHRMHDDQTAAATIATAAVVDADALLAVLRPA